MRVTIHRLRPALQALLLGVLPCLGLVPQGSAASPVPRRDPLMQQAPSTRIILTLSPRNEPIINGQPISWKRLDEQIRAIYDLRPRKVLFVQVDATTDRKSLDRVVQAAKKRGVTVEVLPSKPG